MNETLCVAQESTLVSSRKQVSVMSENKSVEDEPLEKKEFLQNG